MATDLILSGTFKIGATDCSAEVTAVTIKGMTNDVVVPATAAAGKSHAKGANKYEITIDYLADDATTGVLFPLLWTAIGTASKELSFTCLYRTGVVGVGNPQWAGTFVVSGTELGGNEGDLSVGSMTCVMTGAPTVSTS